MIIISLLGAVVVFFAVSFIKDTKYQTLLMILLFVGGILIGGPSSIIGGALSSDLVFCYIRFSLTINRELIMMKIQETKKLNLHQTIVGIIDGSGTAGAAIVQVIIPMFREHSFILYTGYF